MEKRVRKAQKKIEQQLEKNEQQQVLMPYGLIHKGKIFLLASKDVCEMLVSALEKTFNGEFVIMSYEQFNSLNNEKQENA